MSETQAPRTRKARAVVEEEEPQAAEVVEPKVEAAPRTRKARAVVEEEEPKEEVKAETAPRTRKARVVAEEEEPKAAAQESHVDPVAAAPAPARRRAAVKTADSASEGTTAASSSRDTLGAADFDAMTYEDFLDRLKKHSKIDVMESLMKDAERELAAKTAEGELERFSDGTGGYPYADLLTRVYEELRKKNPSLGNSEGVRNQLPVPQIERHGTKKTALPNIKDLCKALNRTIEEVKEYLEKELSTTGSIDSSECLVLKIRNVRPTQLEGIITKYVNEFVKCDSCKKIDSTLQKEDRITVLKCNICGATRTVGSGAATSFQAVTAKRSKLRAANQL
mmetsp:Transcript_21072/g.24423  ORF Transcript_21072/g.24423 Transcript_21072/m.24423 type:complete len:337 (+) Transcript_21072:55-1065(+)|eukprot:CAMPEP_0176450710 /NCGR_PEP_ID=MMETSP0127-20121128/27320_1 /TAXON_ID=938130 /ORGANISM="Platyophrya macrostoma, Strain WH" /LENGTH=336 /DNA_ID=CAMNT_0017838461 /DNA_START=52 /DNA_END=1062 /DNA_ORIENTATION=+